ncbi:MAG: hypothetical protein A2X49_14830 [Lentisphaerae bacterium GWF2_52_8]|nr:MAG: hypothetical protein A2X49_14830 [Lentisphaerae bacterium GWF2_52_8]
MDISAFTARLLQSLNTPAPGPWTVPCLHIHAGPQDLSRLAEIRKGMPPARFLFYIHPGSEIDSEKLFDSLGKSERCLIAAAGEIAFPNKLGLLLGVLKCEGQSVSFSSDGSSHEAAMSRILPMVRDGLSQAKYESRSRLIRLRCFLHNLPSIINNYGSRLAQLPQGTAAVVCGAGPSLSSHLELLKKNEGCFIIIAVGRALPILGEAGINPDLVVEIDPACGNRYPSSWEKGRGILLSPASIIPDFASSFGKVLWFAEENSPLGTIMAQLGLELQQLAISRSVINSALDAALKMGASKIALIGSDLALSKSLASHASDGSAANPDLDGDEASLVEVEGNDGEKLISNTLFCGMKAALEDYLEQVSGHSQIFNCTKTGAKIKNIKYLEFEKFCEDLQEVSSKLKLVSDSAAKPQGIGEKLARLNSDFAAYAKALESSLQCAEKLRDEISGENPVDDEIHAAREHLQSCLKEEQKRGQTRLIPLLAGPIIAQADELLAYTPNLLSAVPENQGKQVSALIVRQKLIAGLCPDFSKDLAVACSENVSSAAYPLLFEGFRRHALSFVAHKNPEFSKFLASIDGNSFLRNFDFTYKWQSLPIVRKIMKDGSRFRLSSNLEMEMQAIRENSIFAKDTKYDPETCAVIFLAPGNWVNAVEFAKVFPQGEFMIIEPWPELFAAIMSRCLFLHHFPESTLVLGVDERLKQWKKLFHAQRREWQRAGKRVLMQTNPRTWQLPEIKALLGSLPE